MQRRPLALLLLVLLWGLLLAALSVARYSSYNAAMLDLGNMVQAIADAGHGGALHYTTATGASASRLGGHAEVIYYALGLIYRLWPDPRLLLAVQAMLAASGAWPVAALARHAGMSQRAALLYAAAYLLMPTAVAAVLFDLHGDTLAMPLLMWLLLAVAQERWARALLFAGLALLCKWYIAGPVGLLGLTLLTARTAPFDLAAAAGRRRAGSAMVAMATFWSCFVLFGLHRWFHSPDPTSATYVGFYFGDLFHVGPAGALDRLLNGAAVLLPTALLWCWAPWTALPALAIIVPSMLTTGPGAAYAWSYHHYAAAVPFLMAGTIDGARRHTLRLPPRRHRRYLAQLAGLVFATTLVFHIGLSDTPLSIPFWVGAPGNGLDQSGYRRSGRDALKDRWIGSNVPAQTAIATSNFLAPHLANRGTLMLVRYPDEADAGRLFQHLDKIEAAYPDALFDFLAGGGSGYVGGVNYDHAAIRKLLTAPQWGLVAAQDGLLAFVHNPSPAQVLPQTLRAVIDSTPEQAHFGDQVALVGAQVTPAGSGRWHATFRWRALGHVVGPWGFPISRLAGVPNARIVHLPVMLLRPAAWGAGQVLEEQFDLTLPQDVPAGSYAWQIGWYDGTSPFAAATDDRSRIGNEVEITHIAVP